MMTFVQAEDSALACKYLPGLNTNDLRKTEHKVPDDIIASEGFTSANEAVKRWF